MFVAAISISVVLPAGCAGLKNTEQQDYVWEMARICDARVAFWKMERVNADGYRRLSRSKHPGSLYGDRRLRQEAVAARAAAIAVVSSRRPGGEP